MTLFRYLRKYLKMSYLCSILDCALGDELIASGFDFITFIHELGHAAGPKHPHGVMRRLNSSLTRQRGEELLLHL
jgi:hypothetical protein